MKSLWLVAAMIIGCGPAVHEPEDEQQPIGSGGSTAESGGAACGSDVVETVLQGRQGTLVVALCKQCDRGCDAEGPACNTYGDACDAHGARGVCAACCDGEIGVLRCHPIE